MKPASLLTTLICMFFFAACQQNPPPAESAINNQEVAQEIANVWKDYINKANSGDIKSLRAFFEDDHVNMPEYKFTQYGGDQTFEMIADFLSQFDNKITDYKQIEVFVHGNMAYEFAQLEQIAVSTDQDTIVSKQRCLSVFKKDNESWKFYRWINQD